MPPEIPLEPGESPPTFRRRIGTAYQLSQNLINNLSNKEESIPDLELQKQIQANMAEAALGLANEPNISKVSLHCFYCTVICLTYPLAFVSISNCQHLFVPATINLFSICFCLQLSI